MSAKGFKSRIKAPKGDGTRKANHGVDQAIPQTDHTERQTIIDRLKEKK